MVSVTSEQYAAARREVLDAPMSDEREAALDRFAIVVEQGARDDLEAGERAALGGLTLGEYAANRQTRIDELEGQAT